VSRCHLFQPESRGHPRGQLAGVDESGELGQPRAVGVNPDVVHARAAQGDGRGTGRDRHERAPVPDGVQGRHANEPGVQRAVHTGGHDAANRSAQALGASDELVGTESADQLLVAGSGDGHGTEPAQHGELQREPAQRAGRARDQEPLPGLEREQVQCLVRGEAVERNSRRLDRRHAAGRGRDRVGVEDYLLGLRADRRGQQIAHPDHRVTGREPVHSRAERIDDASQVPPQADVTAGRHQVVLGELASAGGESTGWTGAACTRMRTCPVPGCGTGTSASSMTSGPP
jgi:hypothetical protein